MHPFFVGVEPRVMDALRTAQRTEAGYLIVEGRPRCPVLAYIMVAGGEDWKEYHRDKTACDATIGAAVFYGVGEEEFFESSLLGEFPEKVREAWDLARMFDNRRWISDGFDLDDVLGVT